MPKVSIRKFFSELDKTLDDAGASYEERLGPIAPPCFSCRAAAKRTTTSSSAMWTAISLCSMPISSKRWAA